MSEVAVALALFIGPRTPELGCRGSAVWAVYHVPAAAGSEAYAVFRSRDAGVTWRAACG